MTIFKHEFKQGRRTLIIWTAAISFMLAVCILIFPDMSSQTDDITSMFADMGGFSQAFGMDKINFGEFTGFFGVECGNVLGLGGAFFAALLGISALAKEEKEHTAEFLLTHPISRTRIIAEKLGNIAAQLIILNLVVIAVTAVSVNIIREKADTKTFALLFLAYFLMQLETAAITFGISAFLKSAGFGTGLGLAAIFYFLNLIANLVDKTRFLKYLTPFSYTESADIIADTAINGGYLAVGMVFTLIGVGIAFWKYSKKDIA